MRKVLLRVLAECEQACHGERLAVNDAGLAEQHLVIERPEASIHCTGTGEEICDSFTIEIVECCAGHDGFVESRSRPVCSESVDLKARQRIVTVGETEERLPTLPHRARLRIDGGLVDPGDDELDAFQLLDVSLRTVRF